MTSQGQEKITKEPTNTQNLLSKHFHTQHKTNNLKIKQKPSYMSTTSSISSKTTFKIYKTHIIMPSHHFQNNQIINQHANVWAQTKRNEQFKWKQVLWYLMKRWIQQNNGPDNKNFMHGCMHCASMHTCITKKEETNPTYNNWA